LSFNKGSNKKEFKKVVHNNYIQKTKDKLSKLTDNSKLYLYNKIKHDIVLEEYLIKDFFSILQLFPGNFDSFS
jgi:hypothetical protein